MIKNNFYIITGGPGVGKTALINELSSRGFGCVREVAREIIKHEMNTGGDALPWSNAKKYSEQMLEYSVRDYKEYSACDSLLFFDRGIPDTYGYEVLMKFEIGEELIFALNNYRYNETVFLLPPWPEIYHTDNERKQDLNEAIETYRVMKDAYSGLGYVVVELPRFSVAERADFVLDRVNFDLHPKI